VKEVFVDSDTKVALLSGAPFDDPTQAAHVRRARRGRRVTTAIFGGNAARLYKLNVKTGPSLRAAATRGTPHR
jgi:hypothetical protein